jgi:hypothetical protein
MKKVSNVLIVVILVFLLLPSSYGNVRGFLLGKGFSWTLSEWTYYILLVALGFRLAWTLARGVEWNAPWKKYVVVVLSIITPFAIGFAEHPIYEDMVWNLATEMTAMKTTVDYENADLVVIAIADCPYCKRAVSEMKALHARKPNLRMRMVVCTADSLWLKPYEEEVGNSFAVVMASDMDVMATHAGGHFPAYVMVRDGKPVCRWTNNEWGPVAKDIVEKVEGPGSKDE